MNLQGTFTALITPFRNDLTVDEPALKSLVRRQLEAGVEGLVLLGTTGEAPTVDFSETAQIFRLCRSYVGENFNLILGLTTNNTGALLRLAEKVQELRPSAILTAAPYYNKPTQKGLIEHFTAIAEAMKAPIILYNVPSRSGVNIAAETTIQLARDPRFIGIKEASGDIAQVTAIVEKVPATFSVLSGNDDQTFDIITRGGKGVISVASNVLPTEVKVLVDAALKKDYPTAVSLNEKLQEICKALFIENNPQAVKTLAAHLGWCEEVFRLPMTTMLAENKRKVIEVWNETQKRLQGTRSYSPAA